ncbi:thioesterase family protein [Brevibacterium sp.]|uniref:thioesterase family protein n=1 Tax=Brevibacterium sp. TaxID=1701 RepID=UPI0028115938|nr:thioesterase family protein [Brevibacterium sp.]
MTGTGGTTSAADSLATPPSATTLPGYVTDVAPEWIDYNGHMSEAYYVLVFGFATDRLMDRLGLDAAYREATGCSLYTVESHIRFLDEVSLDSRLQVKAHLVSAGAKKLHLAYEMVVGSTVVATEEILALHVNQAEGGTVPFPEEVRARIATLDTHLPEWSGRRIG